MQHNLDRGGTQCGSQPSGSPSAEEACRNLRLWDPVPSVTVCGSLRPSLWDPNPRPSGPEDPKLKTISTHFMFLIDVPALANPVAAQASHPEMEGIGESRYPVRLQLVSPR